MKKLFLLIALAMLTFSAGHSQTAFDIKHIPAPLFRCPIYDGAADPAIQWNPERNEWWIFYTQRRANVPNLPGVAYCYGTKIGIAASSDNGRSWYYIGHANLPEPDLGENTFWAPDVFVDGDTYYMIVTYITGVHLNWGGKTRMLFYKSKDLMNWELVEEIKNTDGCIDGQAWKMPDGNWKMWYKSPDAQTYSATSKDLKSWTTTGNCEIKANGHEAPIVFYWKGKYWNIIDECNLGYVGLHCYESDDATNWTYNTSILNTPGMRPDDNDQGRHCDVVVVDDRAFIVYFTHPGRVYASNGVEIEENTWEYKRSSLQMAELELVDGKIVCDRDKYSVQRLNSKK